MRMTLDFELNKVTFNEGEVENVIDIPDLNKKKEQIYEMLGVEELNYSEIDALLKECFEDLLKSIVEDRATVLAEIITLKR